VALLAAPGGRCEVRLPILGVLEIRRSKGQKKGKKKKSVGWDENTKELHQEPLASNCASRQLPNLYEDSKSTA
jgi:hypothetical protein